MVSMYNKITMQIMKKEALNWLKVIGMALYRSFVNYVWLEFTSTIILFFLKYIIVVDTQNVFSRSVVSSMCLVLGVYMAAKTKYYIGDRAYIIWSDEYDFFKNDKK